MIGTRMMSYAHKDISITAPHSRSSNEVSKQERLNQLSALWRHRQTVSHFRSGQSIQVVRRGLKHAMRVTRSGPDNIKAK
jgi:uncharacterized lipoprotein YajG